MNFILNGEKTIETRWSINKIAPFGVVKPGDLLIMKETGKKATATAIVDRVLFFELTPQIADEIKEEYGKEICIHKFNNWEEVRLKNYATLMWIKDVKTILPTDVPKSCGSGWIVLE